MAKDRNAASSVRAALQYNIARSRRYRLLNNGNEDNEHIPTVYELRLLKEKMFDACGKFRTSIRQN